MTVASSSRIATAAPTASGAGPLRRRSAGWWGFAPFAVYVALFLAVPTVVAIASGFFTAKGAFTLGNFAALASPAIMTAFANSLWLSAVVAVVSAVLGAILCLALSSMRPDGWVRSIVDSAASTLAQFGGIMLAFAFIALMGVQGAATLWLQQTFGLDINTLSSDGPLLYQVGGLVFPYVYFSVPLMVLTFLPALEGLQQQWAEAAATLGASRWVYWTRIAMPLLAPAFWGSTILVFAGAFSSFATAAALIDQGGLVALAIKQQLTSETIVGVANTAGVLALGMVVVMAAVMAVYSLLERRARRWRR
ncbi:ABC transporter permease [Microbacterium testaceum]|uniref:ABC transporter permease n=1 Tax=Microbacterium testaceum TaxID=2033 RepID=UPI000CCEB267|nr:ABC transporter permease subunit [Microbacterium testaceum]PNW10512.1 ABC transporter permease [Microbacterium testaceum]